MSGPRLVIADDSALMRTMLESLLGASYTVLATVEDGRAAVNAAQRLKPDIVVLDISMPILDGFEAARQIRRTCPLTHVVFVSDNRNPSYIQTGFDAGGSGYVSKSEIASDLIRAIEEVLAGRLFCVD